MKIKKGKITSGNVFNRSLLNTLQTDLTVLSLYYQLYVISSML